MVIIIIVIIIALSGMESRQDIVLVPFVCLLVICLFVV